MATSVGSDSMVCLEFFAGVGEQPVEGFASILAFPVSFEPCTFLRQRNTDLL